MNALSVVQEKRRSSSKIVFQTILSRRSVRSFSDHRVPSNLVLQLLEAARWAPSGSNLQPWSFVVVENPRLIRLVRMFAQGLAGNPSLIIVLCSEKPDLRYPLGPRSALCYNMNVAMAAENILIMAEALGLGACVHLSFNLMALNVILGIPDSVDLKLLVSVGYPKGKVATPPKKRLRDMVFKEQYGERKWS